MPPETAREDVADLGGCCGGRLYEQLSCAQKRLGLFGRYVMRIVEIRETVVPISSSIRNAFIDFSTMDVSVVAIVTDIERDGRRIVGFGFNSNGRYAPQGLLRHRF